MRFAGLTRVTYRSRKPPNAWQGSPAEKAIDLATLQQAATFFRGNAREAARRYPKNANVTATLALAGLGFDNTNVELIADPSVSHNIHEIEAEGPSGVIELRFIGYPSPLNPRTSALTAYSLIRTLNNIDSTLVVG
jgi:aspartate dehydrogenase